MTDPVWILRVPEASPRAEGPLSGLTFAVKDNIDVSGLPTSAGCPGWAYDARHTAPVVDELLDAGAVLVGKTTMDQFATGLVGTRSPHGAPSSVFDPERISGGSSSGSAIAVARGDVDFALGTDTAGSGRVPAAFNELVGLKPTRGLLSTRGVVPACASLDCVSILARDVKLAAEVLRAAMAFDSDDPWSRRWAPPTAPRHGRLAVPRRGALVLEDPMAAAAWRSALDYAAEHWPLVEVDIEPLLEAAPLLYDGWVAERTADLGPAVAAAPAGLDPTVASIIEGGAGLLAADVFLAMHRLAALRRAAEPLWGAADALLLPTTPTHPTLAAVAANPVAENAGLGRFTNFVNLMDLAAIAVPGPRRPDGLPFGVSLLAPAFHDFRLVELAASWRGEDVALSEPETVAVAVVGAHLSGLPLNHQLTSRGARLARMTHTAPLYRLLALGDRPGLVRVAEAGGEVEAEVWEIAPAALGELVALIPSPLALGRVQLLDGEEVSGFVCEPGGATGARTSPGLGAGALTWRLSRARDGTPAPFARRRSRRCQSHDVARGRTGVSAGFR